MKKLLFILAGFILTLDARSQLIPSSRLTNWTPGTYVGVIGGIPTNRTTLINVTQAPYNVDKTGSANATPGIQAAINAATTGQVVYLPAGTYNIAGSIAMKSNITLRGEGMNLTILNLQNGCKLSTTGAYQDFQGVDPASLTLVTAGKGIGSTVITMASTAAFPIGTELVIFCKDSTDQFGNPITVSPDEGSTWHRKQHGIVSAKTGTTLTFWPPLMSDWSAFECRVGQGTPIVGVGIESLTVEALANSGAHIVELSDGYNCWFKEVRIKNAHNYTLSVADSVNCEFRRCYLDNQYRPSGGGSNGAGLLMEHGSTGMLVEDNIILNGYPGTEINFSTRGSVFAYNVFLMSDPITLAILANHGAHNEHNLFEGNVFANYQEDGYHGSSSTHTVFRNWITGDIAGNLTYTMAVKRFTRDHSLVGNIIGIPGRSYADDGTSFGLPNIGNGTFSGHAPPWADWGTVFPPGQGYQEFDDGVGATLVRKVNFSYWAGGIPSGEARGGQPFPSSLYLSSKPAFFGGLAWPPFDPENPGTPAVTKVPAGYRYINNAEVPPGGPDTTPPAVSGQPSIDTTGQVLTVQFTEPVQNGSGGSSGWTINASGGAATVAFTSGAGSSIYLLGISRPILAGETVTIGYTQPGNGVQDIAAPPNSLATFTGMATTNGSTQGGGVATPVITLAAGPYFGTQSTTITEATPGATIHYTTNGTTPTIASPTYSTTIPIASNMTIKAIATKAGNPDSSVATSDYEVVSWLITTAANKTFAIPAVTTSLPWAFTFTAAASPSNTVVSLGPGPIGTPADWSIAINFTSAGTIQARNGATFQATQTVNYTTAPVVIRVDINYAAKTFSATANNVVFATNYAFASGQPAPVSINYVGLFTGTASATISNMTFQTGPSSGRYIGLRNVTNSP